MAFGVEVCIIGTACIDTSLVDDIFSLETDSDLREIVPRLSLPLSTVIYCEKRALRGRESSDTYFLGIIKSSRNPKLLYKSHLFSFECSTLLVVSRSKRIFLRLYFSRIDLNLLSASVAVPGEGMKCIKIN